MLNIYNFMKIRYLLLVFLLMTFFVNAQLFVSPNSYVYVQNEYVTVTGNVNLNAATSNIYLRNDAQLLQKTTSSGNNEGIGDLSVYQEGTVNSFQYNYWGSPVGNTLANSALNRPFGISQLKKVTGVTTFTNPDLSNVTLFDGTDTPYALAQRWIYTFNPGTLYSQWDYIGNANTINTGEGFTMKGTTAGNQQYDFRGKPNDGTIDVAVLNAQMTLVGNPYPSALDLRIFLYRSPGADGVFGNGDDGPAENPNIDGNALFWEHDKTVNSHLIAQYKGGYGVYNGVSGLYTPAVYISYNADGTAGSASTPLNTNTGTSAFKRRFSPVGQGFMVKGVANGNVQFKNSHRVFVKEAVANDSQFERNTTTVPSNNNFYETIPNVAGLDYTIQSKLETPHIKLKTMLANGAVRQNNLVFMENAIDGFDGADVKSVDVDNNLPFDVYFQLLNTEFVQTATKFDINKKFAIGFKNNAPTTFRMRVGEMVNFSGASQVFLHDLETDIFHDILNADYNLTLPPGVHNNRFEITFQANTLSVPEDLNLIYAVFQNNESSLLTISNPKLMDLKAIALYDISGKLMLSKNSVGANAKYEYNTSGFAEGIYIVKLTTTNNQELVKKVSIYNKK